MQIRNRAVTSRRYLQVRDGNLAGFDFVPALRRLRVPTLVIYADHDLISTATAEQTREALPNARLIKVSNSGHMLFVDQPDTFIESVSAFLASE